ncbi:hypothetical protein [uncultured Ruegeria sp.]|uniref:hypothetical protein n=1 Tax=uncultured Ruegeria sp. TaxID=259304 RepID=UPI002629BE56|nr:hypothetical protein [uncultured Ruegeria sp.]
MPQVESDYALLASMLIDAMFVFGGVPKTFAEQVAERVVKLIETMSPVTWNICAERQSGQGQPAIDIQWQQFATLTGQAFG